MRRVGIQSRVPEQRDGDLRQGDRQGEGHHAGAQIAGLAFGDGGDEVGGARQRQGLAEVADDGGDLARQAQRRQRRVDQPPIVAAPGHEDVAAGGVARCCERRLRPGERVRLAHDADEAVAEQRQRAELRSERRSNHTGLEIDAAIA